MSALGLTQGKPRSLAFATGVRNDLRLLEVDEALLQEIISQGVVIKGGNEDDEAVLCTINRTYAMKLVETTNLQLLVRPDLETQTGAGEGDRDCTAHSKAAAGTAPGPRLPPGLGEGLMTQWDNFRSSSAGTDPVLVSATNTSHIQLVEIAPRLGTLRAMLWRHPYGGEEDGQEAVGGPSGGGAGCTHGSCVDGATAAGKPEAGFTFQELIDAVQASPAELRAALVAEGALQLGGRWRAVKADYLGDCLELLLLTAQQEGMPLNALRRAPMEVALAADGYPSAVVRHCFAVYGRPVVDNTSTVVEQENAGAVNQGCEGEEGPCPEVWALDESKVCIHFARKLLSGRASGIPLSEFTTAWSCAVPYGMTPSLDLLRAEALLEDSGSQACIIAFPVSALPTEPGERFAVLFQRRPRWEWADLEPYLAGVKVPGQSVEALLMRYARASQPTPGSPVVYSAR